MDKMIAGAKEERTTNRREEKVGNGGPAAADGDQG